MQAKVDAEHAAAHNGQTDSLHVLLQAKTDFDKATTNVGATPALAVAWKGPTVSMQAVVHVFCKVEPVLHELVLHM